MERSRSEYRVLVVEDEIIVRKNIVSILTDFHLPLKVVGQVSNGFEALELIEETAPHIVITDIRMPVMDGLQLAREITFAYPTTKVIIITGYTEFQYARNALKCGVADYILKPIDPAELQQSLCKIMVQHHKEAINLKISVRKEEGVDTRQLAEIAQVYLKNNFTNNIYLTELSKELHYTPDYISKLFKKYYQISPLKYVTNLRMNEAKNLLINNPELDIKAISEALGYTNPFYFSNVFKKATNMYPSAYRTEFLRS